MNNTVGERIKAKRQELGYSQDELARKMGYKSRSTINKIELGINDITQSKIIEFAKALETSVSYLMGWTNGIGNQDIGLTTIDVAKWINATAAEVETVMEEMNWPDVSNPEVLAKISAEVQKRKPSTGSGQQKEKATIDVIDDDLKVYLDELRSRPDKRLLFSVTKNATKSQIEAIVKMIEEMQGEK